MATLLPTNLYGESGARFIGTGGPRDARYKDDDALPGLFRFG